MSRSSYSDDYGDDFPGQLELYRANVERSIKSKAGQARLRELRAALEALPTKELQADIFAEGTQDSPRVCALGAWALQRCNGDVEKARAMVRTDADDFDTWEALQAYGWPKLVVLEAVYLNDEAIWTHTPAQRYAYIMKWLDKNLRSTDAPPETERPK